MKTTLTLMKRVFLFFAIIVWGANVLAQRTVTGVVTDGASQGPLIGATVQVKGTTSGAITDIDGKYSLKIEKPSDVLVFSFVGYENQEITVGDQSVISIAMKENIQTLGDLVVIGYGTQKKTDLTGSVAVVTSEDLNRTPVATFDRALQGKASGVLVSQSSGKPGQGVSIRVRGIGSINQASDPIYIVDGVKTSSLNTLNPSDIETMQVLKDASSSAIYGADGANGVILITTKRGHSGKTQVSFSAYTSINTVPKKIDVMNADQYAKFYNDVFGATAAFSNDPGFRQAYYGAGWQKGTDWQNQISQTGRTQNYYMNVSGGSENSNYSISGNYYDETGTLVNTGAKRYNLRANSDFTLGKMFKIGEGINISRMEYQDAGQANGNPWSVSLIAAPLMKVYNPDHKGGYEGPKNPFVYNGEIIPSSTGLNDVTNPYAEAVLADYKRYTTNVLANVYLEFKPFKDLTFRTMPAAEANLGRTRNWLPKYVLGGARDNDLASLSETNSDNLNLTIQNQLTYNKSIAKNNITLTAVQEAIKYDGISTSVSGKSFAFESTPVLQQADPNVVVSNSDYISAFRSTSYLGRLLYDYDGKYLLTASIRRDGNSRFGKDYRFGNFPSFSLGWKLNEDFLQDVKQIDMLKLRFGWGKTGNSNIGDWRYQDFITEASNFSPVFGRTQSLAQANFIYYSFANPLLKWEAAAMTNFGMDLNLFGNKIQLSAEYYVKNTDNLLVQRPTSYIFGRSNDGSSPWVNVGKMQNRGFEFTASYKKYEGDFNYSISANLTTIKNEVKSIPTPLSDNTNATMVGHTVGSLWGYVAEGIIQNSDYTNNDPVNGTYKYATPVEFTGKQPQPGDLRFKDLNGDGVIDTRDQTVIGKAIPDFTYSLNFECSYKGFDLSLFLFGMQNFDVLNQLKASGCSRKDQDKDWNKFTEWANNYYRPDRPSTKYVRFDATDQNRNERTSTWWVENGSFLRVKDIQFGYTLPSNISKNIGISRARVYLSATNPILFTKYSGRDPETAIINSGDPSTNTAADPLHPGLDNGLYPTPKTFTLGVQVDF
jgi:TonB-dependent starch-binding outer membrane protein SusC